MIKILLLLFITVFLKADSLNIGFVKDGVIVKEKILQVIFQVIEKRFSTKEFKVKIKYLESKEALLLYKEKKLNVLAVIPYVYFKNEKLIETFSKAKYFAPINEDTYQEFYLLANKKNTSVMKDLKNYELSIAQGYPSARLWIETLIYETIKKPLNKSVGEIQRSVKESKIIFDVFFKKNKIGVVTKASYNLMAELNPQIKKKITIIKKSKGKYIQGFTFLHKDTSKLEEDKFLSFTNKDKNTFEKSKSIPLTNLGEIRLLTNNDIKRIRKFYKRHTFLKKKYEVQD